MIKLSIASISGNRSVDCIAFAEFHTYPNPALRGISVEVL